MAAKDLILDFSEYDVRHVVADLEEIRRYNPQRFEMEQLTAICFEDHGNEICVGYKDHRQDEFWVRGHMPGMPLLPGVLMCEAAAYMCSYFTVKYDFLGTKMVGFGGLDEVRFLAPTGVSGQPFGDGLANAEAAGPGRWSFVASRASSASRWSSKARSKACPCPRTAC